MNQQLTQISIPVIIELLSRPEVADQQCFRLCPDGTFRPESPVTRQQFAKYGLLRLGVGQDITRIVRSGLPRRIAPAEEVLALKPELRSPG